MIDHSTAKSQFWVEAAPGFRLQIDRLQYIVAVQVDLLNGNFGSFFADQLLQRNVLF